MPNQPLRPALSLALHTVIRRWLFEEYGDRDVDLNRLLAECYDVERLYLAGPAVAGANDVTQTDLRQLLKRR